MLDWSLCPVVERDPDKVSGAWLFRETRVPVIALFENLEGGRIIHIGASGDACLPGNSAGAGCRSDRYFAFTLDVMEVITLDAILNWSLRFSIPCRRAIQSKSV